MIQSIKTNNTFMKAYGISTDELDIRSLAKFLKEMKRHLSDLKSSNQLLKKNIKFKINISLIFERVLIKILTLLELKVMGLMIIMIMVTMMQ